MHDNLIIRKAAPEDLPRIMDIYAFAREFMAAHGNPSQWAANNWPPRELIIKDIAAEKSFVCCLDDKILGVFFFDFGKEIEPTYHTIEDGSWINEEPYGVVHRIASDGTVKGVGKHCISWAFSQCGHLRIDTHPDNIVMQNLLAGLGFEKRGIIHVPQDDAPRYAYELI